MTKTYLLMCGGILMLGACGGAMAPSSSEAYPEDGAAGGEAEMEGDTQATTMAPSSAEGGQDEWEQLTEMDHRFEETLEMGEVDCDSARDLAGSICELAGRVCELAEETDDSTTAERCDDGQERCERAQDRTSNVCP